MERLAWYGRQLLGVARVEEDRLEEATGLFGSLVDREAEDVREWGPVRVRLQLAGGEIEGAAAEARMLLAQGDWVRRDPFVIAHVAEALVVADEADDAHGRVTAALASQGNRDHPFLLQAWGRVLLARGDAGGALRPLEAAAATLEARGYRLWCARTLALVARARRRLGAAGGDRPAIARALGQVAGLGARLVEREVTAAARDEAGGRPSANDYGVSKREKELLALLARGATDQQIADRLFISVATVRSHLDGIRDKTSRRRRSDLTRLAIELGLTADD